MHILARQLRQVWSMEKRLIDLYYSSHEYLEHKLIITVLLVSEYRYAAYMQMWKHVALVIL